jgi:hypothetical protein
MFFKRPPPNQSDRGRLGDLLAGRLRRSVAGVVRATPKPNRGPDHAGAQQGNSHANRRCWIPCCRDRLHIRWAKPWLPPAKSLKPQLEAYTIGTQMRSVPNHPSPRNNATTALVRSDSLAERSGFELAEEPPHQLALSASSSQ